MASANEPVNPTADARPLEVVVVSHTPYFYWWPLWAVGFLMAGLTYWYGDPIAFLPPGTTAKQGARVEGYDGPQDILVFPAGRPLPPAFGPDEVRQPRLRMAASNNLGIIWTLTLCFCVVVTHVPLRGVYSIILIIVLGLTAVLLAFLGLWDALLRAARGVDIHLTAAGYLLISLFLFVIWLFTFLLYDRLVYMVFTRGQLRVCKAVGLGETVYDTRGMVVQKHRDALFRHWLLGFGSGDLTVHTSGANARQFEMPNVLGIDRKLALIHTMLQEREVLQAP
jgi:hypothetical protein